MAQSILVADQAGLPAEPRLRRGVAVTLGAALGYRRTRIGLGLAGVMVLIAVAGPFLAPHAIDEIVGAPFAGGSAASPLGTDYLGRDVLSRLLAGGLTVAWMSIVSASIGMVLGIAAGMLAGYSSRVVDELIMRLSDALLALPLIVFALLFVSMLGTKVWLIVLLVGISHAPQVARVCRAVTMEVVEREFVQSAEAMGLPRRKILYGEVLPNIMTPMMVEFGLRVVWSISGIASLSVLGAGIQPPNADWGLMINENRIGLTQNPLAVLLPVACIAVFSFGVNLIAEGISQTVQGVHRASDR